ncbi:hypothetical protein Q0Z83_060430 [Actinoplanes sichuanensis]|uniref:Uncharacterized protein n=1 Tax=Actinoplanes sichuanensis TaxID=512349 RepID=A0ABW4A628_9ACTN|nr:hypothetical protein [Actinoplanes sichuanensis]BEL07852.1 hypothetical protein Q0Z83_060430 [Actinoplanes sichuanensis]
MSNNVPAQRAAVEPGSRLDDLLATYAELKPRVDELTGRLKSVTDAIKAELTSANPAAVRVDVDHPALAMPLRLSYVESWSLDTKRLKEEQPAVYVTYARKGGRWDLRGRSS